MPDFSNLTLVDKLLFRCCESLREVHPSIGQLSSLSYLDLGGCSHLKILPETIGQLTKLDHLDLDGCVNLTRLPQAIKQLTTLGSLNLSDCRNLTRLPEQLGDMKCLKMLDASWTSIEQLPDSIGHLKELVCLKLCGCEKLRKLPEQIGNMKSLKLFDANCSSIEHLPDTFAGLVNLVDLEVGWCENLTRLPNSLWKLKALRLLNLTGSSKLEQLPQQLGKLQCLEKLHASGTAIEELPDSIGLLSRLEVLDLEFCKKFRNLPNSIWNLKSLERLCLYQKNADTINLPDMVTDMKLTFLLLSCNVSLWLPVIRSLSSLETLDLSYDSQIFSSNELYSLSKLSSLQYLTLHNCLSRDFSISEFPVNLTSLSIKYTTVEMLPELSSLKKLKELSIESGISLQSIPPLPPHLEYLHLSKCTSLQDLPDLSMLKELEKLTFSDCINLKSISLKQSFLQVGQHKLHTFVADTRNKEVAEWFSFKSNGNTLSFTVPPNPGDNFLGVGLWIVYKCKYTRGGTNLIAVITNKTNDIRKGYFLDLPVYGEVDVQSMIQCLRYNQMKSGDIIMVSFQSSGHRPLDDYGWDEAEVKMCGAHLINDNLVISLFSGRSTFF